MRLLLIEDNERFAELLKRGLTAAGFVVDVLPTASDASAALQAIRFEIVVLDLGLPDADGLDVLTEMRRRRDATPVLILTARGSLKDRVTGLGSGADDYLVKPFALEELVARLRALLRRPGNLLGVPLELGNVTLDTVARQVFVGERADLLLAARDRRARASAAPQRAGRRQEHCSKATSTACRRRSARTPSRFTSIACASASPRSAPRFRSTPCAASAI